MSLALLSELDVFPVSAVQEQIEQLLSAEHRPTTSLENNSNCIEIVIDTAPGEYLLPNELLLNPKVCVNIKKSDGSAIVAADWAKVTPSNLFLYSLRKLINLEINKIPITTSLHS